MIYDPEARRIGEMIRGQIDANNERRQETRTTLLKSAAVRTKTVDVPPIKRDPPRKPPQDQRQRLERERHEQDLAGLKAAAAAIANPAAAAAANPVWAKLAEAAKRAKANGSLFVLAPETTDPKAIAICLAANKSRTPTSNAGPTPGSVADSILKAGAARRRPFGE